MIEPDHEQPSIRRQCDLLDLNRATLYYRRRRESEEVLTLMRRVDDIHTAHMTWGSRKIRDALRLEGYRYLLKRSGDHAGESGLVDRSDLHPAGRRVCVSDGGHRLVLEEDPRLGAESDDGQVLCHRGARPERCRDGTPRARMRRGGILFGTHPETCGASTNSPDGSLPTRSVACAVPQRPPAPQRRPSSCS